ncbi:hypothetical protein ACT4_021_01600 [Acinetobacter sp. NBRC 100985]|nr:hypothetical protein ACT4_021_01600 [Acinetobacter sp. NBRC 100985]
MLKDELTSENMIKYAGYSIIVSLFLLIFYEFEFGVMILVTGISLGIFGFLQKSIVISYLFFIKNYIDDFCWLLYIFFI